MNLTKSINKIYIWNANKSLSQGNPRPLSGPIADYHVHKSPQLGALSSADIKFILLRRVISSGIQLPVVRSKQTDVSEDDVASIIRVEE
jgi:hypothetical protein